MGQLSVGEDLFSTLIAVSLTVIFIAVLAHSYNVYNERKNVSESFNLALGIAEQLKNQTLAGHDGFELPGLIEFSHEKLESYSKLLSPQGIKFRVEIRALNGELLFANGPALNVLEQYLFPPAAASLPVAVVQAQGSARLCELSVQVWRD